MTDAVGSGKLKPNLGKCDLHSDESLKASEAALLIRRDQDSVQLSAETSKRFWLRILTRPGPIKFSDFLLDEKDDQLAVAALLYLHRNWKVFKAGTIVVMADILPSGGEAVDKNELVRRHDQIRDVFHDFSTHIGLGVPQVRLDLRAGRFESIVVLRGLD